jgi:hypothetical protein
VFKTIGVNIFENTNETRLVIPVCIGIANGSDYSIITLVAGFILEWYIIDAKLSDYITTLEEVTRINQTTATVTLSYVR